MFETESKPHIQQFKFDIEGGSTDYTKETIRKWEWKFYKKCWVEGRWWPSWLSFKQSYLNIFQRLLTSSTKKYLPTYVSTYSSTFSTSSSMYLIINLTTFQQMDYDFKIRIRLFSPLDKLAGYALGLERLNVVWLDCFRCLFLTRSHIRAHHVQSEPGSAK